MSAILEFAERVKNQVDIVDVIGRYVELRQAGTNHKGLCPFHREKSPSFSVSATKQIFHCFGCHEGGDAIKFIQKIERLEWKDALFQIAEMYNIPVPEFRPTANHDKQEVDVRRQLNSVCELASERFHHHLQKALQSESEIRSYLKNRNISPELVKQFQLGLTLDEWQDLQEFAGKKNYSPDIMLKAGLLNQNASGRFYDRFRNRLIFPIHNVQSQPVAFGARVYVSTAAPDEPKYINSPETPLYHKGSVLYGLHIAKDSISKSGYGIITEGYLDVIRSHQYGFTQAVASCGTALTEEQAKLLKRYCGAAYLAYDGDAAGQKAMFRACEVLLDFDFSIKILSFPPKHDPDSYLLEFGAEALQKNIDQAKPFFDYFLAEYCKATDTKSPEGKVFVVEQLIPLLRKIRKPILKNGYAHKLAERLNLNEALIFKYLKEFGTIGSETFRQNVSANTEIISENPIEVQLIKCFIECDRSREFIREHISEEWLKSDTIKSIIQKLKETPDEEVTWEKTFVFFSKNEHTVSFLRRIAISEAPCDTSEKTLKHVAARLYRHYIMEANKSLQNAIESDLIESQEWENKIQSHQKNHDTKDITKNRYFLKQTLRSNK